MHFTLHNMVAIAQAVVPKLQHVVLVGEKLESTSSIAISRTNCPIFPRSNLSTLQVCLSQR